MSLDSSPLQIVGGANYRCEKSQTVHAFGMSCGKCGKIFAEKYKKCQYCKRRLVPVVSALKCPAGALFVWDNGRVGGGNSWMEMTKEDIQFWKDEGRLPL